MKKDKKDVCIEKGLKNKIYFTAFPKSIKTYIDDFPPGPFYFSFSLIFFTYFSIFYNPIT